MLTKTDLQSIGTLIEQKLEEKLEQKLEEKLEQKLEEKFKFLPTKDEFFSRMDRVLGELQAMREELVLLNGRTSEHTDTLEDHDLRIEKLEKASSTTGTV